MHPQTVFPIIFVLFIFLILGTFAFRIYRNGGFKGAFFGAPIQRKVGELQVAGSSRLLKTVIRVYALKAENSPDREIGLEITTTSVGSYQMLPVTLSRVEARGLIDVLEQAFHSA